MGIEIRGVTKRFGDTVAVNDVTLNFEENKIYGLLGNNGAGKTTLLSLIANRMFATAGSIRVDGEPVENNDGALGKLMLVGDQQLYPDSTRVREALALGERFYPDFDKEYALDLARRFELNLKSKVKALSTGYATILRNIVALAASTSYLLLDEPVLGLDAQHRAMLYKEIVALYAERPRCVVISTHLIAEVANLVEHTVIIDHGSIVCDAPTDELLAGVCNLSGPRAAVEEAASAYTVLTRTVIGGLETVCVKAPAGALSTANLPADIEATPVNLQDYFIACMESRHGAGSQAISGKEVSR